MTNDDSNNKADRSIGWGEVISGALAVGGALFAIWKGLKTTEGPERPEKTQPQEGSQTAPQTAIKPQQTMPEQKSEPELEHVYTRMETTQEFSLPQINMGTMTWNAPPPLAMKSVIYYFGFRSDGYFECGILASLKTGSLTDGSTMRGRQRQGYGVCRIDGEKVTFTWSDNSRSEGQFHDGMRTLAVEGEEYNLS